MYCLPAVIYIGLSIIRFLYSIQAGLTMGFVIFQVITSLVFVWFLYYLCRNGYPMTSWALVLFPIIFIFALAAGEVIIHTASMSPAYF